MTVYIGNGPYCYANSLAMVLGNAAPSPSRIEVLTGSPFGFVLLAGSLPLPSPYGWDPEIGLDEALRLLGWTCRRAGAAEATGDPERDGAAALASLQAALAGGPVLVGPLEYGLLRHHPEMSDGHPIGSDHFVMVLDADEEFVRFHDPAGVAYATLPTPYFLAAWRSETVGYPHAPYTLRHDFRRRESIDVDAALRSAIPGWVSWLRGRDGVTAPPGSLPGAEGIRRLAAMVHDGLPAGVHNHLVFFAIRAGARRQADAALALADLGCDRAATIATRQARLIGSLQYDLVMGRTEPALRTLGELAPTYDELAEALS
jgi:hypothetical protein